MVGAGERVKAQSYDLVPRDTELKGSENSSYEPVTGLGGHGVGLVQFSSVQSLSRV